MKPGFVKSSKNYTFIILSHFFTLLILIDGTELLELEDGESGSDHLFTEDMLIEVDRDKVQYKTCAELSFYRPIQCIKYGCNLNPLTRECSDDSGHANPRVKRDSKSKCFHFNQSPRLCGENGCKYDMGNKKCLNLDGSVDPEAMTPTPQEATKSSAVQNKQSTYKFKEKPTAENCKKYHGKPRACGFAGCFFNKLTHRCLVGDDNRRDEDERAGRKVCGSHNGSPDKCRMAGCIYSKARKRCSKKAPAKGRTLMEICSEFNNDRLNCVESITGCIYNETSGGCIKSKETPVNNLKKEAAEGSKPTKVTKATTEMETAQATTEPEFVKISTTPPRAMGRGLDVDVAELFTIFSTDTTPTLHTTTPFEQITEISTTQKVTDSSVTGTTISVEQAMESRTTKVEGIPFASTTSEPDQSTDLITVHPPAPGVPEWSTSTLGSGDATRIITSPNVDQTTPGVDGRVNDTASLIPTPKVDTTASEQISEISSTQKDESVDSEATTPTPQEATKSRAVQNQQSTNKFKKKPTAENCKKHHGKPRACGFGGFYFNKLTHPSLVVDDNSNDEDKRAGSKVCGSHNGSPDKCRMAACIYSEVRRTCYKKTPAEGRTLMEICSVFNNDRLNCVKSITGCIYNETSGGCIKVEGIPFASTTSKTDHSTDITKVHLPELPAGTTIVLDLEGITIVGPTQIDQTTGSITPNGDQVFQMSTTPDIDGPSVDVTQFITTPQTDTMSTVSAKKASEQITEINTTPKGIDSSETSVDEAKDSRTTAKADQSTDFTTVHLPEGPARSTATPDPGEITTADGGQVFQISTATPVDGLSVDVTQFITTPQTDTMSTGGGTPASERITEINTTPKGTDRETGTTVREEKVGPSSTTSKTEATTFASTTSKVDQSTDFTTVHLPEGPAGSTTTPDQGDITTVGPIQITDQTTGISTTPNGDEVFQISTTPIADVPSVDVTQFITTPQTDTMSTVSEKEASEQITEINTTPKGTDSSEMGTTVKHVELSSTTPKTEEMTFASTTSKADRSTDITTVHPPAPEVPAWSTSALDSGDITTVGPTQIVYSATTTSEQIEGISTTLKIENLISTTPKREEIPIISTTTPGVELADLSSPTALDDEDYGSELEMYTIMPIEEESETISSTVNAQNGADTTSEATDTSSGTGMLGSNGHGKEEIKKINTAKNMTRQRTTKKLTRSECAQLKASKKGCKYAGCRFCSNSNKCLKGKRKDGTPRSKGDPLTKKECSKFSQKSNPCKWVGCQYLKKTKKCLPVKKESEDTTTESGTATSFQSTTHATISKVVKTSCRVYDGKSSSCKNAKCTYVKKKKKCFENDAEKSVDGKLNSQNCGDLDASGPGCSFAGCKYDKKTKKCLVGTGKKSKKPLTKKECSVLNKQPIACGFAGCKYKENVKECTAAGKVTRKEKEKTSRKTSKKKNKKAPSSEESSPFFSASFGRSLGQENCTKYDHDPQECGSVGCEWDMQDKTCLPKETNDTCTQYNGNSDACEESGCNYIISEQVCLSPPSPKQCSVFDGNGSECDSDANCLYDAATNKCVAKEDDDSNT